MRARSGLLHPWIVFPGIWSNSLLRRRIYGQIQYRGVLKGWSAVSRSVFTVFALAASVVLTVGAASATTVSLRYDGGTATGSVDFTSTPGGVTPAYDPAGAFGFRMTDVTAPQSVLGSFVAWCLDLTHPLGTRGNHAYTITSTPFSNSYGLNSDEMMRVQSVFDANFSGVDVRNRTQAAAFQVALWNSLYDADMLADAGIFAISNVGSSYAAIAAKANLYLSAARTFSGPRVWNLTFLESAERPVRQNLVTATPVPLPAGAGLLLLALGGLGVAARRRTRA